MNRKEIDELHLYIKENPPLYQISLKTTIFCRGKRGDFNIPKARWHTAHVGVVTTNFKIGGAIWYCSPHQHEWNSLLKRLYIPRITLGIIYILTLIKRDARLTRVADIVQSGKKIFKTDKNES